MNPLVKKIKAFDGTVLAINVKDDIFTNEFFQNQKIITCDLLENIDSTSKGKPNSYQKTINIKDLYKKYKRKKIDYFICDIDFTSTYLKYILKSANQITKKEICFYGKKEMIEKLDLPLKAKRYKVKIESKIEKDKLYLFLKKEKSEKIRSFFYFILDVVEEYIDKITEVLEK